MSNINEYIYKNARTIDKEEDIALKTQRSHDLGASLQDYLFSGNLPDEHILQLKYEIIERDQDILKIKGSSKLAPFEQSLTDITHNIEDLRGECENLRLLVQTQLKKLDQWNAYDAVPALDITLGYDELTELDSRLSDFIRTIEENVEERLRNRQEERERKKQELRKQLELEMRMRLDEKRRQLEDSINSEIESDRLRLSNKRVSEFIKRKKQEPHIKASSKKNLYEVKTAEENWEFEARFQEFISSHNTRCYSMEIIKKVLKNDEFLFNLTMKDPDCISMEECYRIISLCKEQEDLAKELSYEMRYDLKVYGDNGRELKDIITALQKTIESKKDKFSSSIFWWK